MRKVFNPATLLCVAIAVLLLLPGCGGKKQKTDPADESGVYPPTFLRTIPSSQQFIDGEIAGKVEVYEVDGFFLIEGALFPADGIELKAATFHWDWKEENKSLSVKGGRTVKPLTFATDTIAVSGGGFVPAVLTPLGVRVGEDFYPSVRRIPAERLLFKRETKELGIMPTFPGEPNWHQLDPDPAWKML